MQTVPGFDAMTKVRLKMVGVWCCLAYISMLVIGWGALAGFLPPIAPDATQDEVVQIFKDDHTRIILGMIMVMAGAFVFVPFAATLVLTMRRIEGGTGVLTISTLMLCVGNMMLTFIPAMTWIVASYRTDRDPATIYLMHDMAWLWFVGGASILLMMAPIAAAAFLDRSPEPVFPRWAGYLNLWVIFLIIPDQLLFFFDSGPFSWHGIIGIWIPLTAFGIWFGVMFWLLRKAVLRERDALTTERDAPGTQRDVLTA